MSVCRKHVSFIVNILCYFRSLFAGIAFSYARLGNVHAMSHPVSAFFDVPHGVANAVLLPVIAEYNALADHGRYLKIYNYISEIPAYADEFEPMMLVGAIRELTAAIGIPASLTDADFWISIAGNTRFSCSFRSSTSSILPVPVNSS